jgi:hypothetical protein
MDSVYSASRIRETLDWIWFDLTRPENREFFRPLRHDASR